MSLKRLIKPAVMHTIGHQTPAVQNTIATMGGTRGASSSKKRRSSRGSSKKAGSPRRKRKSGGGKSAKKLVAGSAAAKAWGAKMKRLRKKKG